MTGVQMTGEQLIQQFEDGATPPGTFHHVDHVRLAFEYLKRYPALEALGKFSVALKRFAATQGKAERYHETITWASLLLIRERMARVGGAQTWAEFAEQNPDLLIWKGGVLATLYRQETLDSALARSIFILPDQKSSLPQLPDSALRCLYRGSRPECLYDLEAGAHRR